VLRWQETHAEPIAADEGLTVLEVDTTGGMPRPPIEVLHTALLLQPSPAG